MEIRWLEAFIAVAEELHFAAAARLKLAQSPLSQTIRRLERDLGTTLFDRNTRSVTLTPAGQALLPLRATASSRISSWAGRPPGPVTGWFTARCRSGSPVRSTTSRCRR